MLLLAGTVSAVKGILYALVERDLKRLLAFSSIENVGIILSASGRALVFHAAGLEFWPCFALAAALYHAANHAAFKALLFLGAGAVVHATGTRDMEALGGLIKRMPVDRRRLPRRLRGHRRPAPAQWLRERMAHLSGAPADRRRSPGSR